MTDRARRVADELVRRGWSIENRYGKDCPVCGDSIESWFNYCVRCGTKAPSTCKDDTLTDLEAAIAAAVDGTNEI